MASVTSLFATEGEPVESSAEVVDRGPSPEEAELRDRYQGVASLFEPDSQRSSDPSDPRSESVGLYPSDPAPDPGLLTSTTVQRVKESSVTDLFDDTSFEAMTRGAIKEPLSSISGVSHWQPPKKAAPYLDSIREAEELHEMPENLVAAIASAESAFDPNAKSPAGARGLMQIMPQHHPGVDADDPEISIAYGAEYVAKLKNLFGTWELALAAYNWGPGNLVKYGIENAPKETRDYIKNVLSKIHDVEDR